MSKKKAKNIKPQAQPISEPKAPAKKSKRLKLPVNLLAYIGFAVFLFVILIGFYGNYLRKVEALSLFLGTSMFFDDLMARPGGLLPWIGTYLTQFMHYPWLGAAIYATVLGIVAAATAKAFRIPVKWRPAAVAPAALMALAFLRLGYLIFTLKPLGYAFSLPIGSMVAIASYWGFRLLRHWTLRSVAVILLVIIGYPLFGFYALFGAAMCVAGCILDKGGWLRFVPAVLGAAAIAVVPRLWFVYVGGNLIESQIYISGLPRFYSHETGMWVLHGLIFAVLLVAALMAPKMPTKAKGKSQRKIALGVWAAAMLCVLLLRYNDKNFMLTLDLDRALWEQKWSEAVKIAENFSGTPTRLNTVLGYVALIRNGDCADRMFQLKYGWEPYATTRNGSTLNDAAAALISYHLGLINYAYRWGTEYTIEQGMSAERLKIMAKCALLNYELPLAKTYLDILYNTPFHRDWAKKYLHYQSHPMDMSHDPELVAIRMLMCQGNEFINDGGSFEGYVWPLLAEAPQGTIPFNELSLEAALVSKRLDCVVAKLPAYAAVHPRVPRYLQEAALLWSVLEKKPAPIDIDPQIVARHEQFLQAFRRSSGFEAEEQRDNMREAFGDTYWFYFIFTDNMPLI